MWGRALWIEVGISARAGAGALDSCLVGHYLIKPVGLERLCVCVCVCVCVWVCGCVGVWVGVCVCFCV